VCGQLYTECPDLDYFPSYELIATPFSRGAFFEDNMRSVTEAGVQQVMDIFFSEHSNLAEESAVAQAPPPHGSRAKKRVARQRRRQRRLAAQQSAQEVVCEEEMLEAFNR
jgi:hypothetical protein